MLGFCFSVLSLKMKMWQDVYSSVLAFACVYMAISFEDFVLIRKFVSESLLLEVRSPCRVKRNPMSLVQRRKESLSLKRRFFVVSSVFVTCS